MPVADPREALIRDAFQLQRVANSISGDRSAIVRHLFDEIAALIAKIDPTAPSAQRYRIDRANRLLDQVEKLTGETFDGWYKDVRSDLARLGRAHAENVRGDLVATLGHAGAKISAAVPTQNMMKAILDRNPFAGETLSGWAEDMKATTLRRIRQQVQVGMMNEESMADIVRRVRGKNGKGGVWDATYRDTYAIVRTAVTDVAAYARTETFKANQRIVKAARIVASLDVRTCPICASFDGKTVPLKSVGGYVPFHVQCRCTWVAVIDWEAMGLRAPAPGLRLARDPRTGKWMQVPTTETYEQWLRDAPHSVQDDILGPARAGLFRSGKVGLDELVGSDRRLLTLDQLAA